MTMMRNTVRRLKRTMRIRRVVAFWLGIATMVLAAPRPASAVPAFARKYGVRCTVCHEAWPVLNDFGRAFRDNGYRMNLGKDQPTAIEPGYRPDVPISRIRDLDLTGVGLGAYAYHTPGSASNFDMASDQPGLEFMGHNRGSRTRYSVSVFNVSGAQEKAAAFNTPGVYGHFTQKFFPNHGALTAIELGA